MAATRRLAAIMFTDMVGYTASTQTNEARTLELLREQEKLIRPLLKTHRGREIKSTGDGVLVEFESALKALQCAVDIQRRIYERNAGTGLAPFQIRIGIHLGDVEPRGTDILGDAVNIAARIEPVAEPGGICVSGAVHEQVWNKTSDKLEKLPPKALKGLQVPTEIYRVVLPWTVRESPSARPGSTGLAILPFANISPDQKDEYFADGLTEELITVLSHIRELRVIARTSVMQYKSTSKPVSQIGAELGVSSILEGSVRKSGNRLRITAQLIDVGSQGHVWAATYDRELDDVFAIQTEIAEETADALQLELLGPERESIRKPPTTNLAAYELYLKGIHATRRTTYEGFVEANQFFEAAIRSDPGLTQAYAELANGLISLAGDALAPGEAFPRASELVAKALGLDPNSSEAHMARGNLALQYDHDWVVAEAEFQRSLSLNPSNAQAHYWYGFCLKAVGRFDDAAKEFRATIELDPMWWGPRFSLGEVQCLLGDFASAIASAEELRDRQPENANLRRGLAQFYVNAGRIDDARREAELAAGSGGKPTAAEEWGQAVLWAQVGDSERARGLLREMEVASRTRYVSPQWIASVYAALGETERAFEWLEREEATGPSGFWLRYQWAAFDPIRDDPRFRSMLTKLNIPADVTWARPGPAGRYAEGS